MITYFSTPQRTFKSITGTFTVPTPHAPGSASFWVGIDGNTCAGAILQTGIDAHYVNGEISYNGWSDRLFALPARILKDLNSLV